MHIRPDTRLQYKGVKISTSSQLHKILYTDSHDMLILSSTPALCYYTCYTGGTTSLRTYGSEYHMLWVFSLHQPHIIQCCVWGLLQKAPVWSWNVYIQLTPACDGSSLKSWICIPSVPFMFHLYYYSKKDICFLYRHGRNYWAFIIIVWILPVIFVMAMKQFGIVCMCVYYAGRMGMCKHIMIGEGLPYSIEEFTIVECHEKL
jgi:hypothetical protein